MHTEKEHTVIACYPIPNIDRHGFELLKKSVMDYGYFGAEYNAYGNLENILIGGLEYSQGVTPTSDKAYGKVVRVMVTITQLDNSNTTKYYWESGKCTHNIKDCDCDSWISQGWQLNLRKKQAEYAIVSASNALNACLCLAKYGGQYPSFPEKSGHWNMIALADKFRKIKYQDFYYLCYPTYTFDILRTNSDQLKVRLSGREEYRMCDEYVITYKVGYGFILDRIEVVNHGVVLEHLDNTVRVMTAAIILWYDDIKLPLSEEGIEEIEKRLGLPYLGY